MEDRICILIFVDKHMVEHGVDVPSEFGHLHQLGPIEQEIVIVEDVLFLLGFDIGFEQAAEILLEGNAPWKVPLQDVIESLTGVDGLQIDSKAGRRQLDLEFSLDQLADRRARPQRELHFQLLGPLFHDQLLNVRLLIGREVSGLRRFSCPASFGLMAARPPCYCYLPLYIFCGRELLLATLRPANIDASAGAKEEVAWIIAQVRESWPDVDIWLRADSGFCREELMAWCENNRVHYVFGLARNARLEASIADELAEAEAKARERGKPERLFKELRYAADLYSLPWHAAFPEALGHALAERNI